MESAFIIGFGCFILALVFGLKARMHGWYPYALLCFACIVAGFLSLLTRAFFPQFITWSKFAAYGILTVAILPLMWEVFRGRAK